MPFRSPVLNAIPSPICIKRSLTVITALIASHLSFVAAYADTAPYVLRWYFDDLIDVKRLDFTVMVDRLEIQNVVVNKGNCPIATTMIGAIELSMHDIVVELGKVFSETRIEPLDKNKDPLQGFPLIGVFGEALAVYVPISCNILRVEITTSGGNWISNFNP